MGCCGVTRQPEQVITPSKPVFAPEVKVEPIKAQLKKIEDNIDKFQLIINEYEKNHIPYLDKQFPLTAQSLGNEVIKLVDRWERPPLNSKAFTEFSCSIDIKSGVLCNYYFVSALSALSIDQLKNLLLENNKSESELGAYYVKTYYAGKERFTIVDSYFPTLKNGNWAFSCSVKNNEVWPQIFEKVFAKIHGSYQNIIKGKISYVLASITDGEPYEVEIEKNIDTETVFNFIVLTLSEKTLLVAESHASQSEENIISSGIIPNMGYLVTRAKLFNNEMLIRLRHPFNNRGIIWNGDWAAGSYKWSKKAKYELNFDDIPRGEFYMTARDFVNEFCKFSLCYNFDQDRWTKNICENIWTNIENEMKFYLILNVPAKLFLSIIQEKMQDSVNGFYEICYKINEIQYKSKGTLNKNLVYENTKFSSELIITQIHNFENTELKFPLKLEISIIGKKLKEIDSKIILKAYSTDKSFSLKTQLEY